MLPRLRHRLFLLWSLFTLATLATGLAVHRLYQTAQQEISEQSARAQAQEQTRILVRTQTYTAEVRRATLTALASFHVDGLASALRKWDAADESILGTFQWDAARGFPSDLVIPPGGPGRDELALLWTEFHTWRLLHPTALQRELTKTNAHQTLAIRTLDNPALPPGELGYQGENLDILTHDGRRADPWAGWAASDTQPDTPWIAWYQAGPAEPVRGCFVDPRPVLRQLRGEITDTAFARLDFVPAANAPAAAAILPGLPAYRLTADHGAVFHQKETRTRLTALLTAALFGVFLTGAMGLALYTRRASRNAERKITFVTQVSHELRTPLTSIRMFADMLAEPELAEAKRLKFAHTISTESGRLGALIEHLLAFNALEKNGKKTACTALDVSALVRTTAEEMSGALRNAGLDLELVLPEAPVSVLSDHTTLKQALLNLLDNAIKYARDGRHVQLKLVDLPGYVALRVADQGAGIPPALRERVFEPFVQVGQKLTNKAPGVGLGLSLARGMLRQAGADLVLLDASPGCTFEIRLPKIRQA